MYRVALVGSFLALLALSLVSAGLAIRGSAVADRELERTRLAHEVLEAHLQLEAYTYALFKQLTDAILAGGTNDPEKETARRRLTDQIETTRLLIAREVAVVGDREDESEELVRLAAIERLSAEVMAKLAAVETTLRGGGTLADAPYLGDVLDRIIDRDLRRLIDEAAAEEREEVEAAEALARETLAQARDLSAVAGGLALAAFLAALTVLLPRLSRPLARLRETAERIAAGDLERRVPPLGRDEFGAVAESLNRMLDELERRRGALDAERNALEDRVSERTAALSAANAALQAADERRRGFLADVSHELRTPITIIRGEAEVTLRARAPDIAEHRAALERIAEQAVHTARLVDDLLFVARAEAEAPRIVRQSVVVADLARRCCDDMGGAARERGVELGFGSTADETATLGDPGRLRQLVMILLDNALRYARPGGRVDVAVTPSPQGVALRVADDGIGVSEAELPHVFDRFFRGSNAVERDGEGAGLGLAMARTIVEAHRGQIAMESRLGEGSTVTVILPAGARMRVVA
jgi:signal transduction histidine kinase